jgi:hypothetical protein
VHALLAVVCYRAPEQVPPRHELQLAVDDLTRLRAGEPEDPRAPDAPDVEVVRVLAAVDELDDHAAGPRTSSATGSVAEPFASLLERTPCDLGFLTPGPELPADRS